MSLGRLGTLLVFAIGMTWFAARAGAQVIIDPFDPIRSTLQSSYIAISGQTAGEPDLCSDQRCGNFVVTIRNFANDPVAGSAVMIDFSGCADIQIACDQLTASTGQTYLGNKRVVGFTNASGQFTFRVIGASNAILMAGNVTAPGTSAGVACAQVYADGVVLTPALIVAAYDVNGAGSPFAAVNSADASLVAAEGIKVALGATARARDDYNQSNTVTAADASIAMRMGLEAALGTGSQNTGPFCP